MTTKAELLAPAGHWDALKAAIENGADAVYFGVDAHNARARAANFDRESLCEIMTTLHSRGVRGYLTLNTLIFPSELDDACSLVQMAASAGVDALIVQDVGLARLARLICPELPIHASTQMTITSAAGVRAARELGCDRVILARELAIDEIAKIHGEEPEMPLEVFVHGALCVAYSGQCLTSEALGGRSANRGECAQACRMPYEMHVDGRKVDLGDKQYLLSPQDLAAYDLIPRLIDSGVVSFKVEGRLKSAEYVANVTQHYRRAIDAYFAGKDPDWSREDTRRLELAFSRGLSSGFLRGNNHKYLVRGNFSNKRGPHAGFVEAVDGLSLIARLHLPIKAGDGVMIDVEDNDQGQSRAVGGRVYRIEPLDSSPRNKNDIRENKTGESANPAHTGRVRITFMRDSVDFGKVLSGQAIWQTDDQRLDNELRETYSRGPRRRLPIAMTAKAFSGKALELSAGVPELGITADYQSPDILKTAEKRPADEAWVREHAGKLGDTPFELIELQLLTDGKTLLPASLLNQARRELAQALAAKIAQMGQGREVHHDIVPASNDRWARLRREARPRQPELTCLVRNMSQLKALVGLGIETIYADFQDIKEYREACHWAHDEELKLWLATPRIEKPGEYNLFKFLEKCQPAGILVRNAGGIEYCRQAGLPWVADFSLNITNGASAEHFYQLGARRLTAGFDLNTEQLSGLLDTAPPAWYEVVIHQRVAMFHMEHCVFCMVLSPGTDKSNCGRPCDEHHVHLEDRVGARHTLSADVGCRNTLFNATAQSAAAIIPMLKAKGVAGMRLEFVDEPAEVLRDVVISYQSAMAGKIDNKLLWKRVKATNQYGLTRGSLQIVT
ncbi:MAG: DUF3656 domain-containing protein [bacterium]